ncbi:hypothetical protein [Leucobacter luti]|uniref:hypothetical protein n=1 Tax=Leucobacter luti TaxID=340320 RepID=UPI001C6911EB|nr:hypothetical protein [Leucobacter luti]QYM74692.1 hypothetical protein K1X41_07940 [Leucobacter luti]
MNTNPATAHSETVELKHARAELVRAAHDPGVINVLACRAGRRVGAALETPESLLGKAHIIDKYIAVDNANNRNEMPHEYSSVPPEKAKRSFLRSFKGRLPR